MIPLTKPTVLPSLGNFAIIGYVKVNEMTGIVPLDSIGGNKPDEGTCITRGCSECCKDMILSMTYRQLAEFISNTAWNLRGVTNVHQIHNPENNVVYFETDLKYTKGSKSPIGIYSMEELLKRSPDRYTKVYIPDRCPHLIEGLCGIYGQPNRPKCCSLFKLNGPDCKNLRQERGVES